MTALLAAGAALYGLAIGSFLNVVVYRVPAGRSVVRPGSACPACGQVIAARDNIPVLSWVLLRGRCRNCGDRISWRYPAVELLTAGVYVALALRFGATWTLPAEVIFCTGLIALALIDFDHMKLPRVIVYITGASTAAALVVAAAVQGTWHRLLVAAVCAAVEFAGLFLINFASPRALGFGDVRLGPVLALALGWLGWRYALWGFVAADALGVAVGVALIAARRARRNTRIPFGVFLALGAFATLLYSGPLTYPR